MATLPQWISMINDTQLDSGEQLHWECRATGKPRPTYRWLRNGEPLNSQSRVEMVNGELIIHRLQQADSGMYQCIAENKYGAIYSSAELKILGNCFRTVFIILLFQHKESIQWEIPSSR
ncbi:Contactin-5 [Labeo rohita]|uniref:Contactin-5 n=1 Tax=Labeo rohita TaxID=84645 RepID=A0ABQ8LTG2_LABRO|nr:Contactin-5 [Labeo rohita]